MPKIPQAIDYGGRPSVRTNRLDPADKSGIIVADAISSAAESFTNILLERKGKQDALQYANAKSNLLAEDIRLRRELQEADDFDAFEERYRTGMQAARDKISLNNEHDRAIFDADATLTVERGVSAVMDLGRRKRIDTENAELISNLDQARADILDADPMTRNDMLLNALSGIEAAAKAGNISKVDAEKQRMAFTEDVARAELSSMDPLEREEALKKSITANPSVDKVKSGKGSGSLADFLHQETRQKLLREAIQENKTTRDRLSAYETIDKAWQLHPEDGTARMKYIREHSKGDVREVAVREGNQRNAEESRAEAELQRNTVQAMAELMRDGESYDQLPASDLKNLTAAQDVSLRRYSKLIQEGEQFAEVTNWTDKGDGQNSYSKWNDLSAQEKLEQDLDSPEWITVLDAPTWKQLVDQKEAMESGSVTQDAIMTDDQLVSSVVVSAGILPKKRSDSEDEAFERLRFRFRDAVGDLSLKEYGGGKVPYIHRRELLFEIIGEQAWLRDAGWFGFDADEPVPSFTLSPKQVRSGFIPLQQFEELETSVDIGGTNVSMTWPERLTSLSRQELNGYEPTQKDMENAFFAIRSGLDKTEVLRRLSGKGDE